MLFRSSSGPTVFYPQNARILPFRALTAHKSGKARLYRVRQYARDQTDNATALPLQESGSLRNAGWVLHLGFNQHSHWPNH